MHMADALVSPAVATASAVAAATLIGISAKKVGKSQREDIVPLMGVMGAFVFAAQMINFTIPGTGSSGHVVGGILLAAMLGPWAAFLTLSSVLVIQCLVFADGGLLALGCNVVNMAATSCLIAYPLVYRPIAKDSLNPVRLMAASVLASVVALEIGATAVTAETELSGITALPTATFLKFMLPIHLVIGAIEGAATGAVLVFLAKYRPETLMPVADTNGKTARGGKRKRHHAVLIAFGLAALILGSTFSLIASENPDGLEWSVEKVAGWTDLASKSLPTAVLSDYDSSLSGIIGALMVMAVLWGVTSIIFHRMRKVAVKDK